MLNYTKIELSRDILNRPEQYVERNTRVVIIHTHTPGNAFGIVELQQVRHPRPLRNQNGKFCLQVLQITPKTIACFFATMSTHRYLPVLFATLVSVQSFLAP